MTIKELLLMIDQKLSDFPEIVNDEFLEELLYGATVYERDWSTRNDLDQLDGIFITYNTSEPFDIQQLDKELAAGFHVYWNSIHFGDILIEHFPDKTSAFKYYRTLTSDILACSKALIDTSKGIIVGENLTGNKFKKMQYDLFRMWIKEKYPIGTKVQLVQLSKNSVLDIVHSRASFVGKIGTVTDHDLTNVITIDFEQFGKERVEIGRDQIRIIQIGCR